MKPETMMIDDVKYVRADKVGDNSLLDEFIKKEKDGHPYELGSNYFIRTVTHYFTGRLVGVYDQELALEDVAWIADTGRYSDALKTGAFSEVEPYPDGLVVIGRGSIIDAKVVELILPRTKK